MKVFPSKSNKGFTASWIVSMFVFIFFHASFFCFSLFEVCSRIEMFWCLLAPVKSHFCCTLVTKFINPFLEDRPWEKLRIKSREVDGSSLCHLQRKNSYKDNVYQCKICLDHKGNMPIAAGAELSCLCSAGVPLQTSAAIKERQQLNTKFHAIQNIRCRRSGAPRYVTTCSSGRCISHGTHTSMLTLGIGFHCHVYQAVNQS